MKSYVCFLIFMVCIHLMGIVSVELRPVVMLVWFAALLIFVK